MNLIRIPTQYNHPKRTRPLVCFIVHTTGSTNINEIVNYYKTSDKGIGPHYMVDYDGTVRQFVEETDVAYHAGYGPEQVMLYKAGWAFWSRRVNFAPWRMAASFPGFSTWWRRWGDPTQKLPDTDNLPRKRGLQSPLELVCGDSPNGMSIGIELREPEKKISDHFTDAQYEVLISLIRERAAANNIKICRDVVLGHEDVNPISRCDKRGGWDPGEDFNWNRLLKPFLP